MSWTFNPPPGWPAQPEGWQPPPGWSPDPSWPRPPADWQFWVPAGAAPAAPPPPTEVDPPASQHTPGEPHPPAANPPGGGYPAGPAGPAGRPWYQHWSAAGGAALAVLLVGCLGGAAVAVVTSPDEPATAPPEPTGGPTPQSTTPAPAPTGSGLSVGQERQGEGPAIVELDLPDGAVRTITITFTDTDSYQMSLVDDDGELVGFLGAGSGSYTGTHLLGEGFSTTDTPAALDIVEASGGSWTVRMQDIAEAPTWPQQSSGTGYTVLRIDPNAVAEPTPVTGTHDGEANFIVWAYSENEFGDRLLFNEIGEFSGSAQEEVAADVAIMEIQADGAWTVDPG